MAIQNIGDMQKGFLEQLTKCADEVDTPIDHIRKLADPRADQ